MTSRTSGKGLILDWGSILTTPINDAFDAWMIAECIESEGFFQTLRWMHNEPGNPLHQVEVGIICGTDFEASLASRLGTSDGAYVVASGLLDRMFVGAKPNTQPWQFGIRARERRRTSQTPGGPPTTRTSSQRSWTSSPCPTGSGTAGRTRRPTSSVPRRSESNRGIACSSTTCAATSRVAKRSGCAASNTSSGANLPSQPFSIDD